MMKAKVDDDARWMAKHFPTVHARKKADEAMDALDVSLPMSAFLDAWIAAYFAAGGKSDRTLT
jgi:hypothetical protein